MKTQDIINMGLAWKQVTEAHGGDMPSKDHVMKMCKDGMSEAEMLKMHPDCDQEKLKAMIKDCKGSMDEQVSEKMSSKEKMAKGLYNSFVIPEDVPMDERDMFMAKAAAAHKAGKSHFSMPGGKKHPVTMQKDTAKAVNSDTQKEDVKEGDAQSADRKPQMYIDPTSGKKKVRMVPTDDKIVDKNANEGVEENKAASLAKKLAKASASSEKGKAAVTLPKAPFPIPKKESAEANQELEMVTEYSKPNSVSRMREAMMQMYQEAADRADHYKGASKPDGMKDNLKGKGAKDMADQPTEVDDTEEKGHDDVSKAGRAGPTAKARSNDNMKGDKAVVNPVKK
jgi:hypothetical protein